MNVFEKEIIERNCNHPSIIIIDINTFDAKCLVCDKIVTKHEMVEILKKESKRGRKRFIGWDD